jgi:protein-S-isoprenylcysteine O-methyltransferase Ste14
MGGPPTEPGSQPRDPGALERQRVGGWLFKKRTALPLPLAGLIVLVPASRTPGLLWLGLVLVAMGEGVRLWAVHHIGAVSRTRTDRLGPLIDTGPFAWVRNPLYLGNIALWTGFALSTGVVWLAVVTVLVLGLEYHAIVRWEETLLTSRIGAPYRAYTERVPRWLPKNPGPRTPPHALLPEPARFSWRDTLYSERGTLIAIAVGCVVLLIKLQD